MVVCTSTEFMLLQHNMMSGLSECKGLKLCIIKEKSQYIYM